LRLKDFVAKYGQPYSSLLGINLRSRGNEEIVKWFLAAILYSKSIRESSATKTYRCFERREVTTAKRIVEAGWNRLVEILDEGGYTRYDFSTADKLLEVFGNLEKRYGGDLTRLYKESKTGAEVEANLKRLGKGIGDTTVSIFLRDMRHVWRRGEPKPTPLVTLALEILKVRDLEGYAKKHEMDVVRLETALLRYSKDFLKKTKSIRVAP
jgi:DNA polymerase/3'-5' exonuclease PolX